MGVRSKETTRPLAMPRVSPGSCKTSLPCPMQVNQPKPAALPLSLARKLKAVWACVHPKLVLQTHSGPFAPLLGIRAHSHAQASRSVPRHGCAPLGCPELLPLCRGSTSDACNPTMCNWDHPQGLRLVTALFRV